MVSSLKLMGYALQLTGMAIMFFGLINLVMGLQKTVGFVTESVRSQQYSVIDSKSAPCDPKENELCGVDITDEGAIEKVFSEKVSNFLLYLGAGLAFTFLGVLLRAGEEIGGFIAGTRQKEKERVTVGKIRWHEHFK